ncbi:putative cytochrome p450 protein [Pseudohyphozyma bogoriensis]|nr:putative cytochrome p450 protein [Pseudohyphozyma bogoriensis]
MSALDILLQWPLDERVATAATGVFVLVLLTQVPRIVGHLRHYLHFFRDHEDFWVKSASKGVTVVPFHVPWPGAPNTQYFLLNQKLSKAMFANTPALDHRESIDAMHDLVWDVPMWEGREITKAADKMITRSLVKTKIGPLVTVLEQHVMDDIAKLRADVGANGARVPFAHRSFSLIWNCSINAMFGVGVDATSVRGPCREMMHNANICYLIELLPVLPRAVWYAALPKARTFRKGRKDLHDRLETWLDDEKALVTADPMVQEVCQLFNSNRDKCSRRAAAAWIAMLIIGLAVNTSEVTGWMFSFLLQSPALYQAIREEVNKLPNGPLCDIDLKAQAPLLSSTIQETLRVRGSIFSGRTVKKEFELPGYPRKFKSGDLLRIMSPAARLDAEIWGDDALAFRGDRFMKGGDSMYNSQLAFGGGATACPGRYLAIQELLIVVAHLIQNFDYSDVRIHHKLPDEGSDLACGPEFKLGSGVGTLARIVDLDGAVYSVRVPDQENSGCEIPSGILPPLQELGVMMKPRSDVDI